MTDHKHERLQAKKIDELIAITANVVKEQIKVIAKKIETDGSNDNLRPCELSLPIRTLDSLGRLRIALFGGVAPSSGDDWMNPDQLEDTIRKLEGVANSGLDAIAADPED